MQEKEFLQGYEIKNWDFTPRFYKILAAATVINLLSLFVIGQTNMLTQSACESPFVNRVCSVLDTVYISARILTTNAGYIVKDYEETNIRDADIVWVDQTNVEPMLTYPAGYFKLANGDDPSEAEIESLDSDSSNGIRLIQPPITPITPPIRRPRPRKGSRAGRIFPNPNDGIIEGDLPDDPLGDIIADPNPSLTPDVKTPAGDANANVKPDKNPLEEKTATNSAPISGPEKINKKPLYDFADAVLEKVTNRTVDLGRKFRVTMNAFISEDGKLDVEKSKWLAEQDEGDEAMIAVAKDAVEKVGDSGWLIYLSDQGIRNVRIVFYQDEEHLAANIISVMSNENEAKRTASGFRLLLSGALAAHRNGLKKFKEDELTLIKAAEFTSEGNLLKINFNLKKDIAQEIIDARLKEYQAKKEKKLLETPTPKRPNGGVGKFGGDTNTARRQVFAGLPAKA